MECQVHHTNQHFEFHVGVCSKFDDFGNQLQALVTVLESVRFELIDQTLGTRILQNRKAGHIGIRFKQMGEFTFSISHVSMPITAMVFTFAHVFKNQGLISQSTSSNSDRNRRTGGFLRSQKRHMHGSSCWRFPGRLSVRFEP